MVPLASVFADIYYATAGILIIVFTLALAFLLRGSQKPPPNLDQGYLPSVSIVIPTYNEASIILQKLENVLQVDYPREKLEIMVVDSASNDGTGSLVRRFAGDHLREFKTVLIEQPSRQGKSQAINEALGNVRSEVIILTDADVTFDPNSIRKLVRYLDRKEVGAVSGIEVPVGEGSFLSGVESDYRRIYTAIRLAEAGTDAPFMCESELSAYRRDVLGPLPPGTVCDDVELTVMIKSKGYHALYASDVSFLENEAGSFGPKLNHKLRRGMNNQHALLKNARVFFNPSFGRYGTIIFPFEFFVHIISPILLTLAGMSLIGLITTAPFAALAAILTTIIASVPSLLILNSIIAKFRQTEVTKLQGSGSWILGAATFLAFQFVLLVGLLKLSVRGPQTNWQQVPGTRVSITVEAAS